MAPASYLGEKMSLKNSLKKFMGILAIIYHWLLFSVAMIAEISIWAWAALKGNIGRRYAEKLSSFFVECPQIRTDGLYIIPDSIEWDRLSSLCRISFHLSADKANNLIYNRQESSLFFKKNNEVPGPFSGKVYYFVFHGGSTKKYNMDRLVNFVDSIHSEGRNS
jgi:hypothetical protein